VHDPLDDDLGVHHEVDQAADVVLVGVSKHDQVDLERFLDLVESVLPDQCLFGLADPATGNAFAAIDEDLLTGWVTMSVASPWPTSRK